MWRAILDARETPLVSSLCMLREDDMWCFQLIDRANSYWPDEGRMPYYYYYDCNYYTSGPGDNQVIK